MSELVHIAVLHRGVVVAVTNGQLDGSIELAKVFGPWERIFAGQAERLARES